jgi:hypothetical protein
MRLQTNLRLYPGICLEKMKKNIKQNCQRGISPCLDMNLRTPGHRTRELTAVLVCWELNDMLLGNMLPLEGSKLNSFETSLRFTSLEHCSIHSWDPTKLSETSGSISLVTTSTKPLTSVKLKEDSMAQSLPRTALSNSARQDVFPSTPREGLRPSYETGNTLWCKLRVSSPGLTPRARSLIWTLVSSTDSHIGSQVVYFFSLVHAYLWAL